MNPCSLSGEGLTGGLGRLLDICFFRYAGSICRWWQLTTSGLAAAIFGENSAGARRAVHLCYLIHDSMKLYRNCCPTFHFPARMCAKVCDKLRAIVIPLVY